jgi:hypothetical protein
MKRFCDEIDGVANAAALCVIFRFIIFNRAACSAMMPKAI